MKPYDPNMDYCGPGKSFLTNLIPNRLLGINLNSCCYFHDTAYENGGTGQDRYHADLRLRDCVYGKLVRKWWVPKFLARTVAGRYFTAVRVFGSSSFNYTAT